MTGDRKSTRLNSSHTIISYDWSSDVCSSDRSEEHTCELQSHDNLVCRLLLEKKAVVMQILSARLGGVTGKALAQAWRAFYPSWSRIPNLFFFKGAGAPRDLPFFLASAFAI